MKTQKRKPLPPFFTVTRPVPTFYTVGGCFSLPTHIPVQPIFVCKLEIVKAAK